MPEDQKSARVLKVYTLADIERLDRRIERLVKLLRLTVMVASIVGCIGFGSLIPHGIPVWQAVVAAIGISLVMTQLFPKTVEAWINRRVYGKKRKSCPPQE